MFNALIIYYLIAIVYIIIQYRKDRKNSLVKLLIVFFCPFISCFILYYMFHNIKRDEDRIPEGFIKIENEKTDALRKIDFEKETSIIPMKDALQLNDNQTKRKLLMDILKNDTFNNIEILKIALQNEDSETSHYAATAIQDIKGNLLTSMQQLEFQLDKQPNDLNLLTLFAQVIKQYLNTGFLDERTRKRYLFQYSQILENIIEIVPQEKLYYMEKINCDLLLGEIDKAEVYCQTFLKFCSNEEEAYFMSLKLYYSLKDQLKFQEILQMLRESPVRLTPKGLNKIRFWLHGDING